MKYNKLHFKKSGIYNLNIHQNNESIHQNNETIHQNHESIL